MSTSNNRERVGWDGGCAGEAHDWQRREAGVDEGLIWRRRSVWKRWRRDRGRVVDDWVVSFGGMNWRVSPRPELARTSQGPPRLLPVGRWRESVVENRERPTSSTARVWCCVNKRRGGSTRCDCGKLMRLMLVFYRASRYSTYYPRELLPYACKHRQLHCCRARLVTAQWWTGA